MQGLVAAWAVIGIELVAVAALRARELAGFWELQSGALFLSPVALLAAGVLGSLGGLLFRLLRFGEQSWARLLLALASGTFGTVVGWGVGTGRHLAEPGLRGGFAFVVGAAAAALVAALSPGLARALARRPRSVASGLLVTLLLLELANRFLLPRLYPAFHWGLAALCLLLAPGVAATYQPRPFSSLPAKTFGWVAGAGLVLSLAIPAALLLPSARQLSRLDNFRLLLLDHAPLLGRAVELSARLVPPEPWDAAACGPLDHCAGSESAAPASGALDFRGRDLLLISIDAVRADHLGAYGYARPTTPNIDRLAQEAAVFERAYTATPHTSYAITSLMTGKYLRPLLQQGAGADSDTWASLLRTYGYRTAAFYPPALFFIDTARFEAFRKAQLGFEYSKIEFAEGQQRIAQVREYLDRAPPAAPLFVWVHLFSPHEPYEQHPEHVFGERDLDRYDSEIAAADATVGELVARFRKRSPNAAVILTADHGEEFGEHGGRYHGTTVYEEQLRVPLLVSAPGALKAGRHSEVVQTIDLLPTVLSALDIPRPPRLRGRDLGELLAGKRSAEQGFAHGESDDQSLLARGPWRLICARRIGACQLFDLANDPLQRTDVSGAHPQEADQLRRELKQLGTSHGRYESQGLRAEGKGWPAPILRGLTGDADAAAEVSALLDDVDPSIRRKAAEVLVELRRPESAPALRLALGRDEDMDVRRFAALALTRLGEGAPLAIELLHGPDPRYKRLAALALGESGDRRAGPFLVEWWRDEKARDYARSREILAALAGLRFREAVPFLTPSLLDVRLRPELARTLAAIGDESARIPLARALTDERSQSSRVALTEALVALGGKEELVAPLVRFMGVPDPLPNALKAAERAKILLYVGGPPDREMPRVRARSELGARVVLVVPKGGKGQGVRALVRAGCPAAAGAGEVLLGSAAHLLRYDRDGKVKRARGLPELDMQRTLRMKVECTGEPSELFATLPETIGARPGASVELIVFASREVTIEALALVPLADELPPPAPKPWKPDDSKVAE